MSIVTLEHITRKARKEYPCDLGWDVELPDKTLTFSELRIVAEYKKSKRRILKGQSYISQVNICDGSMYRVRMHEGIYKIFSKYELFPEY